MIVGRFYGQRFIPVILNGFCGAVVLYRYGADKYVRENIVVSRVIRERYFLGIHNEIGIVFNEFRKRGYVQLRARFIENALNKIAVNHSGIKQIYLFYVTQLGTALNVYFKRFFYVLRRVGVVDVGFNLYVGHALAARAEYKTFVRRTDYGNNGRIVGRDCYRIGFQAVRRLCYGHFGVLARRFVILAVLVEQHVIIFVVYINGIMRHAYFVVFNLLFIGSIALRVKVG